MNHYTKRDILKMVEEEDVGFIRLQFTDIFGMMKNVAITTSQLKKALDNQIMFDGSSIEGFARIRICTCIRIWIHLLFFHGDRSRERWLG